jgi:hypothetical protein
LGAPTDDCDHVFVSFSRLFSYLLNTYGWHCILTESPTPENGEDPTAMEEDAVDAFFEADSEVIIRCENGKSYSIIVTNGEYALVFSNTLKGEF